MAQFLEQREHPRVKFPVDVACIGDYKVFDARTDNFSLSGALLVSEVEVDNGREMVIVINPRDGGKLMAIPVEVIRSERLEENGENKYEIGVRYYHLSSDQHSFIQNYLQANG
jgi:hypothetical protein